MDVLLLPPSPQVGCTIAPPCGELCMTDCTVCWLFRKTAAFCTFFSFFHARCMPCMPCGSATVAQHTWGLYVHCRQTDTASCPSGLIYYCSCVFGLYKQCFPFPLCTFVPSSEEGCCVLPAPPVTPRCIGSVVVLDVCVGQTQHRYSQLLKHCC